MKKINLITAVFTIMIAVAYQQTNAQTWKPFYDYDKSIAGFEDADGNRKDMKYESTTLVDEENPLYSIVVLKKEGAENALYGIVDNNTLKLVFPIKYKNITVDKQILVFEIEVPEGDVSIGLEIYNATTLKKIYQNKTYVWLNTKNNYVAFANEDGKHGVIDANGKIIIPFIHGGIQMFDDNLFETQPSISGPSTIINNLNKVVIAEKTNYDYYGYSNGFFIVYLKDENSKQAFVNNLGNIVFKGEDGESLHWGGIANETKCGYIHGYGNKNLQKLYDLKGKSLLPAKYYGVSVLTCNLVEIDEGDFDNRNKRGVYNIQLQKQIIPSEYKYISFIEEKNQIQAKKGDNEPYVYFDTTGKIVSKK